MKGLAAIVTRKIGKGRIIVMGTLPEPSAFGPFLLRAASAAGVAAPATASTNLLVVPREGQAGRGLAAVELEGKAGSVTIARPARDLVAGRDYPQGGILVPPHGVLVLQEG